MWPEGIGVAAVGAIAPVGRSSLAVALRALGGGRPAVLEIEGFERARGARLAALGAHALREAAVGRTAGREALVFVAFDERPEATDGGELLAALARAADLPLDPRSQSYAGSRVRLAAALSDAAALLERREADEVFVGAVDSLVDAEAQEWLERDGRLAPEGAVRPSEGAGFLRLVRAHAPLCLAGCERDDELADPNIGAVTTALVRRLLGADGRASVVLCDANGERHRQREWSMVAQRETLAPGAAEHFPAHALGELGAATGAVYAAMVCALHRAGRVAASEVVVVFADEGAGRAALLLAGAVPVRAEEHDVAALHPPRPAVGTARERARSLDALAQRYLERERAPGARSAGDAALVAELDALMADGLSATEWHPGEPERPSSYPATAEHAFATVLALGSVASDRALEAALALARAAPPQCHRAIASALGLAPNPDVSAAIERWLGHESEALVSCALDALALRGGASCGALVALVDHPNIRVRVLVARALAGAAERPGAIELLLTLLDPAEDDRVALAAADSLLRLGSAAGLEHARGVVDGELAVRASVAPTSFREAARLVAVAGTRVDSDRVRRVLMADPASADLAGRYGDPSLFDDLVVCAERSDATASVRARVDEGLRRLTGAAVRGAGNWLAWRERHRLPAAGKLRLGKPYAPLRALDELDATPEDELLRLEVDIAAAPFGLRTRGTRAWSGAERRALTDIRAALAGDPQTGGYPGDRLR